jgi:predicted transposase YdaD
MSAQEVRNILEEIMSSTDWPVYSPFAREHFRRGKLEGRAEGRLESRVEGRLEGRAEEAANLILMVLSTRGLSVSDDVRTRITRCADLDRLEIWAERAVTAATADDLFR